MTLVAAVGAQALDLLRQVVGRLTTVEDRDCMPFPDQLVDQLRAEVSRPADDQYLQAASQPEGAGEVVPAGLNLL